MHLGHFSPFLFVPAIILMVFWVISAVKYNVFKSGGKTHLGHDGAPRLHTAKLFPRITIRLHLINGIHVLGSAICVFSDIKCKNHYLKPYDMDRHAINLLTHANLLSPFITLGTIITHYWHVIPSHDMDLSTPLLAR